MRTWPGQKVEHHEDDGEDRPFRPMQLAPEEALYRRRSFGLVWRLVLILVHAAILADAAKKRGHD